jgi:hypothetical protein
MDNLKQLVRQLRQRLHKERTVENNNQGLYTEEQLMARLKFFIGICLALTLFGIVFVVLYSLIFVTQPLNAISPIDQKFFELIVPIATFLTGTLSGIMLAGGDKEAQKQALAAANKGWDRPPTPPTPTAPTSPAPTRPFSATLSVPPGAGTVSVSTAPGFNGTSATSVPETFVPGVGIGYGGKPAPVQPPHPEI